MSPDEACQNASQLPQSQQSTAETIAAESEAFEPEALLAFPLPSPCLKVEEILPYTPHATGLKRLTEAGDDIRLSRIFNILPVNMSPAIGRQLGCPFTGSSCWLEAFD